MGLPFSNRIKPGVAFSSSTESSCCHAKETPCRNRQKRQIAAEISIRITLGQRCQRILQPVNKAVILIFDIFLFL